jgi:hypothetical protein
MRPKEDVRGRAVRLPTMEVVLPMGFGGGQVETMAPPHLHPLGRLVLDHLDLVGVPGST